MAEAHADIRAGYCRITMSEGGDLYLPVTYRDALGAVVNLSSGWTATMQVWQELTDVDPVLELTEGDGITLASTSPNVLIDASPAQSVLLLAGGYRYGVRLLNGTTPRPLLYGPLIVEAGNVQ